MDLLSGHEKIITNSGISLNAGTLNRGFTVLLYCYCKYFCCCHQMRDLIGDSQVQTKEILI
jgi:hypothetical protein